MINRPITTLMVALFLIVAGLFFAFRLPIEIHQVEASPQINIHVSAPGYNPFHVETIVSSQIEAAISTIAGITNVESRSSYEEAVIKCHIDSKQNLQLQRSIIQDVVLSIELPAEIDVSVSLKASGSADRTPAITYVVYSDTSLSSLQNVLHTEILPTLRLIPDVADIRVSGGDHLSVQIHFDQAQLRIHRLDVEQVTDAIKNAVSETQIGTVETTNEHLSLNFNANANSYSHLLNMSITVNDHTIPLRHLAKINISYETKREVIRFNGLPAILVEVFAKPESSVLNAIRVIKERMKNQQQIEFHVAQDQSVYIYSEFESISNRAIWSLLTVVFILLLINRRINESLLLVLNILITACSTFILFYIFDISLNLLSIAGIVMSFGMIVDNSIILIEQFGIKDERKLNQKIRDIVWPIAGSTISTILVMIPIAFISEDLKTTYAPFGIAMALSLMVAFFVSFFITPIVYDRWVSGLNRRNIKNHPINNESKLYFFFSSVVDHRTTDQQVKSTSQSAHF